MKTGDICPHCGILLLKKIKGKKPHTIDYLQCPYCNSIFECAIENNKPK